MPFFVTVSRQAEGRILEVLLARIRQRLALSATTQPGRRATRVFQQVDAPSHLLALSEWTHEQAFVAFIESPHSAENSRLCGGPPVVTPLIPLIRAEYMARRASIVSCVTLTVAPEHGPALRGILTGEAHQQAKSVPGIVSREAYAARDQAGKFLVIHSWQALADLERFRATAALELDELHAHLGTRLVSFTGAIIAQFSAFGSPRMRDYSKASSGLEGDVRLPFRNVRRPDGGASEIVPNPLASAAGGLVSAGLAVTDGDGGDGAIAAIDCVVGPETGHAFDEAAHLVLPLDHHIDKRRCARVAPDNDVHGSAPR
jgi:heme-degrading monooxygenase HmoA